MMLSKKKPIITSSKILKEISEEKNISITKVEELYEVWRAYIRTIAQDTSQASIYFPKIGFAYYLLDNKEPNEELKKAKQEEIDKYLTGIPNKQNGHHNREIYKFYGIMRKDPETKKRIDLKKVVDRQRKSYEEENYEDAELV